MIGVKRARPEWISSLAWGIGSVATILVGWELLVRKGILPVNSFSSPKRVLAILKDEYIELLYQLLKTISAAGLGFLVAFAFGPPLGYLMAQSRTIDRIARPIVEFLRPLPSTVMILVSAIILGIGWRSEIAVVAYGSIWPLLINTYDALATMPKDRRHTLALLNLGALREFWFVQSRAVLPALLSGVRVSTAIALILAVTFELILTGIDGIGGYLLRSQSSGDFDSIYAGVVVVGIGGLVLNIAVALACEVTAKLAGLPEQD